MNYMKQVAENLGVKMGERFDIDCNTCIAVDCYFDENGLRDDKDCIKHIPYALTDLLNGRNKIIKKPFKPRNGDKYYLVIIRQIGSEISFEISSNTYIDSSVFDLMALSMGNCFRSEAEAEEHKDEIIAKFREVIGDAGA